jgi:hypothetical protein
LKRPGCERQYRDIPDADVAATVDQFQSIGDSVERFQEFVNGRAA